MRGAGARVMTVVGGAHVAVCDVRVDLRGRDVAVAKERLDGARVSAAL